MLRRRVLRGCWNEILPVLRDEDWREEMIKAEDWWKEFQRPNTQVSVLTIPDIRKIQADAIRAAVDEIRYSDVFDSPLGQLAPAMRLANSLDK